MSEQSYKTWFEPIRAIKLQNDALVIQVPNRFFYEWLEEHYIGLLKQTIKSEIGPKGRLEYKLGASAKKKKEAIRKEFKHHADTSTKTEQIKNPFTIPGIKKVRVDSQLNPRYTFDNYVEGECNKMARSAGLAIAENPGGTAFNPFVIYSHVGLGKTHLAHAIGNQVKENFPEKSILYVSSDRFTSQLIESLKKNEINDFVNFYQSIDFLIIDDIQFLEKKMKTQEIFFHVFNQLHQNRKQIIMTSDRPPKDLRNVEDRLVSRFKWGLTTDLQVPEYETRIAILTEKMQEERIKVSPEVIEFIAYNVQDNVRELEGVLISLTAQASLNQRTIDIDLARKVIKNFVTEVSREVTTEFIQELVAEQCDVTPDQLQGKTRKRAVVIARQISMFLAKSLTEDSLKQIGKKFGNRDHSTVIYSCKAVKDSMDTDIAFKDKVNDLEKKIKMTINS